MTMKSYFAILFFMCLGACTDQRPAVTHQSSTPGDEYNLTADEVAELSGPAKQGNAEALFRLIQYYTLVDSNLNERIYWQRIAAEHGNITSMFNLSVSLSQRGSDKDCGEAWDWLGKVEASTKNPKLLRSAT